MSAPPNPDEAVAPPSQPNNSTLVEDGDSITSSTTITVSAPPTDLLDAISSSPLTDISTVSTPPAETPPVETPPVDIPEEVVEARPIATPPVPVPDEFPLPPVDGEPVSISSDLASTNIEPPPSTTSTESSSVSTTSFAATSTLISSTEQPPLRSGDEQDNVDRETVAETFPATSLVIETPPPVVEASPTDRPLEEATSADEPTKTTAEPSDDESSEEPLPDKPSALPIDEGNPPPDSDSPPDRSGGAREGGRDRAENVEIIEQPAPIVAGPDEQVGDSLGEDADDHNRDDGGFLGDLPAPTIILDDPSAPALPDGTLPTVRPGGRIPPNPESDVPPGAPSETGRAGLVEDGDGLGPAVIAGSVVGGVLGLALMLGLLIWFLKRRSDNRHQYVIKTPVFPPPKTGSSEKTWEFDTGSLGPTTRSAKLAEVVSDRWHALRNIFKIAASTPARSGPKSTGVSASRRDSNHMADTLPPPAHSRHNSVKLDSRYLDRPEPKGVFMGWWSHGKQATSSSGAAAGQSGAQRSMPMRRSSDIVGYEARRTLDSRRSKAPSEDFAAALGLMLKRESGANVSDPFSDNNEIRRNSAGPARLSSINPFADTHAVGDRYPALHDDPRVHRPRGSTTGSIMTPPPPFARPRAPTLDTRSYVRSDQFDLEIDGHNASISLSNNAYDDVPRRPASVARTHGRESYSSRIVSSISSDSGLDGWGEPGPDVGMSSSAGQPQQQGRHTDRLPHIGEAM